MGCPCHTLHHRLNESDVTSSGLIAELINAPNIAEPAPAAFVDAVNGADYFRHAAPNMREHIERILARIPTRLYNQPLEITKGSQKFLHCLLCVLGGSSVQLHLQRGFIVEFLLPDKNSGGPLQVQSPLAHFILALVTVVIVDIVVFVDSRALLNVAEAA